MYLIRNLPLQRKIVAVAMIVTAAALVLAGVTLILIDFNRARADLLEETNSAVRILAYNAAAAAAFKDAEDARAILDSLANEQSFAAACLYTDGLLAEYHGPEHEPCPPFLPENGFTNGYLIASSSIDQNGTQYGTVSVRATLAPMYAQIRARIAMVFGILLLAGVIAYALSSRLKELIAEPVLSLAATAGAITAKEDYSIRAIKHSNDEVGQLSESFNQMLSLIEKRNSELKQRTEELVLANRMKDEFLATLSHELRTPLNSMLGWIVLLREGRLTGAQVDKALASIDRNVRLQASVINDLLDVSRIISGKFTMESSVIELQPVMERSMEVVKPAAQARQTAIHLHAPHDAVLVSGDSFRLQQVFWNLLSNAVKFSPEKSVVEVSIEEVAGQAVVRVKDKGVGITAEFLPHVFDRFRQADSSSTREYGGLGLGLSIVRHIVEMHGGKVWAESDGIQRGSTFSLQLPLAEVRQDSEGPVGLRDTARR
jgi:signal transduction histidine kinase